MVKNKIMEINQKQELAKFEPRWKLLVKQGIDLKIVNEETKLQGIDLIRELNLLSDQYRKLREYLLKPIKDHIKNIEGDIKPFEKAIENVVGKNSYEGLRGQLSDYETKMEEERKKEEERLRKEQQEKYQKEVKKADKKGEIAPPPPPPVIVEAKKEEGVSYRDKSDFVITDEKLIPREYLIPDEKKIRKVVEAGIKDIPGIEIFTKKVLVIRDEKLESL